MMYWVAVAFVVAVGSALLGFGGIAGSLAVVARTLFVAVVVLFLASVIVRVARGIRTTLERNA